MDTTRMSSKGQVIIPKALREAHGWTEGTELIIEDLGDGVVLRPSRPFAATTVQEVLGCTGYKGPAVSLEDMEAAIRKGVLEETSKRA
jgi:AbrB family looped-hinge helix DNA binding protein